MKTTCDRCGATLSDGGSSCQHCRQPDAVPADLSEQQYRTLLAKLDTSNTYLKAIERSVGFLAFVSFLGLFLGFLVGVGAIS